MGVALDIILVLLVVAVAGWTVIAREARTAVIAFIGLGLLLGLVWVRLSSIDVALTEASIGGAATGILLLRACARLQSAASRDNAPGPGFRFAAVLLCGAVSVAIGAAVLAMPEPAPTLAPQAAEHMAASDQTPTSASTSTTFSSSVSKAR